MLCRFPQLAFDYVDPVKNFDRSKVRGPIAKLIQVKDVSTATALEVVAGGRVSKSPWYLHFLLCCLRALLSHC